MATARAAFASALPASSCSARRAALSMSAAGARVADGPPCSSIRARVKASKPHASALSGDIVTARSREVTAFRSSASEPERIATRLPSINPVARSVRGCGWSKGRSRRAPPPLLQVRNCNRPTRNLALFRQTLSGSASSRARSRSTIGGPRDILDGENIPGNAYGNAPTPATARFRLSSRHRDCPATAEQNVARDDIANRFGQHC